jgi:hypothetical protein
VGVADVNVFASQWDSEMPELGRRAVGQLSNVVDLAMKE